MAITLITLVFAATYILIYACESVSFAFGNTSAWHLSPLGEHGGGFSTILTTILTGFTYIHSPMHKKIYKLGKLARAPKKKAKSP